MLSRTRILFAACFVVTIAFGAGAAPLEAGVSVANITPDPKKFHVPLGGYGERMNKPATGIHDYTLAKTNIFRQGDRKFALVTCDLLGIVRPLREQVLARIKDTGITSDNLMISASHTHASVEMNALHSGNIFGIPNIGIFDQKLLDFTADQIAAGIIEANKTFVPIKAGTGSTEVTGLNRNRRGDPTVDPELTVTRIDTVDGKPLAVFVNFTAHPTYVGAEVMEISAEWPGYLQREVEAFMPGTLCLYSNGAEGDTAPSGGQGPSPFARAEDHGRKLAIAVLDLVKTIQTSADAKFDYSMTTLKLPPRKVPPALVEEAGPEYGLNETNIKPLIEALVPESSMLGVLRLGDLIAIAVPGELFSRLGLMIKHDLEDAGAPHPIIVGLGNEWISYMMPPEEFTQGGYEPGVSFYGDQLGPVVTDQAIAAGTAMIARK
jgi:neutral ceramidase